MSFGTKTRWVHMAVPHTDRNGQTYYVGYCPTSRNAHNNIAKTWKETTCPTCWAQLVIKEGISLRQLAYKILEEGPE